MQDITNILLANQQHLEFLCLELIFLGYYGYSSSSEARYYFRESLQILPPNLKYLRLNEYPDDIDAAPLLFQLAAEQCPKLSGVEFYGHLTFGTINAISIFEKFVAF